MIIKIRFFACSNKTSLNLKEKLEKKLKKRCVKKVEKIFVKMTKGSKTTPFFVIDAQKNGAILMFLP